MIRQQYLIGKYKLPLVFIARSTIYTRYQQGLLVTFVLLVTY